MLGLWRPARPSSRLAKARAALMGCRYHPRSRRSLGWCQAPAHSVCERRPGQTVTSDELTRRREPLLPRNAKRSCRRTARPLLGRPGSSTGHKSGPIGQSAGVGRDPPGAAGCLCRSRGSTVALGGHHRRRAPGRPAGCGFPPERCSGAPLRVRPAPQAHGAGGGGGVEG